jgi:hypothetical protein
MREDDARRQLEEILRNAQPGEEATVQTEGQIEHPHGDGDDEHTDAWSGRKEADGSVTVEKLHT